MKATELSKWNRFKYRLMGSPKYCKECGHNLEWTEYGADWSDQSGKKSYVYIRLGCIWEMRRDNQHTHIIFGQRVT